MSVLSFTVFCIEHYAEDRGLTGPAVYAQFKREGLLAHLRTEYEDLHGMGKEFLMRYFDSFLGVGKTRLLFHGSTVEVREPMILHGDMGREFGAGFYITSHREQATRWAKREVRLLRKNGNPGARAIVNGYGWNPVEGVKHKVFEGATLEWLERVIQCRRDSSHTHGYDIVEGNVANDTVGETISYVDRGIMRKEDAFARLQFEKINDQIAFCSHRALASLRFLDAIEVEV